MKRGRTSNTFFVGVVAAALLLFITPKVHGQYGEYGQYGAPVPSKSIMIDKMISVPNQAKNNNVDQLNFVDNLSSSDVRFAPDQQIVFKLKVKNTSDVALTNVQVKDFVPALLVPVSGPGNFDANSRTLSFDAGNFASQEEKTYFLTMKITPQDQMPIDQSVFCEINKAQASNSEVFDQDTAQFCIEKQVLGVKSVPSTGPEFGLVLIGLEFGALGVGVFLKKRPR